MGRVNVEERCFGELRLSRFERLLGWDRRTALGCLVLLWHESQDKLAIVASAEQIAEWVWATDRAEGDTIVHALLQCGYLEARDTLLLIKGNEEQIDGQLKSLEKARKGGESTRRKWDQIKAKSKATSIATSLPQASQEASSSLAQVKASQGKASHNSPNGESERHCRSRAPYQELLDLWNANNGTLSAVRDLPDSLRSKVRARWAEKPDLVYWADCVRKMAASTFCCEGKWATFQWLFKNDQNHTKVAAGNYDNVAGATGNKLDWEAVFKEPT